MHHLHQSPSSEEELINGNAQRYFYLGSPSDEISIIGQVIRRNDENDVMEVKDNNVSETDKRAEIRVNQASNQTKKNVKK